MEPQADAATRREQQGQIHNPEQLDFWLQAFRELTLNRDILGLKILEKLYVSPAHPYALPILFKDLRSIVRSKRTLYSRLRKLESMGLIDLIRSRPVAAWPKREIPEQTMRRLVKSAANQLGVFYVRR